MEPEKIQVGQSMNAEKLKIVAAGMGYEVHEDMGVRDGQGAICLYIYHANGTRKEYCPDTTNNDQMVEIMEKALEINELVEFEKFTDKYYMVTDATTYGGKTLAEAVCKWAYEHYKAVK